MDEPAVFRRANDRRCLGLYEWGRPGIPPGMAELGIQSSPSATSRHPSSGSSRTGFRNSAAPQVSPRR